MGRFGSSGRSSSGGNGKTEMIQGILVDKKAAPKGGDKRLIVRTKGGGRRMVGIDISAAEAKKLERKESYSFEVEEKGDARYANQRRRSSSSFRSYQCVEPPEKYSGKSGEDRFNRFGGGGTGSDTSSRRKGNYYS